MEEESVIYVAYLKKIGMILSNYIHDNTTLKSMTTGK
jgi:hypothetical protein